MTTTFARSARRAALAGFLALGGPPLAPGAAAPAAAATLIQSCPYTIIAPGTYVLGRDLTCPGEDPAITIAADNVRLDLGGHTLTGDGDSGEGVEARGTADPDTGEVVDPLIGLRIQNGTVSRFRRGVDIDGAPGARVAGVTATGSDIDGIFIARAPGARITGNTASGNDYGIYLDGCDGCEVAGNRADDNGTEGFVDSVSLRARFRGNAASRNGDDGFDLAGCQGCVVTGNRADANGGAGIEVRFAGGRVDGNTATGNGQEGIVLFGRSPDNQLLGNTTTGNGVAGIRLYEGAVRNRLEGNRATGNVPVDLVDENAPATPCPNAWRANRFATDSEGDGPAAGCIR